MNIHSLSALLRLIRSIRCNPNMFRCGIQSQLIRDRSVFMVGAGPEIHQRLEQNKSWSRLWNRSKICCSLVWDWSQYFRIAGLLHNCLVAMVTEFAKMIDKKVAVPYYRFSKNLLLPCPDSSKQVLVLYIIFPVSYQP